MSHTYWLPICLGASALLIVPTLLRAVDLKVTEADGNTFTLTEAAIISYEPEGSMGGPESETAGFRMRTTKGMELFLWKTIQQIQITGRGRGKVHLRDGTEGTISYGLQNVTGQKNGKAVSIDLDKVSTMEVLPP
jgi:hypothetical protein